MSCKKLVCSGADSGVSKRRICDGRGGGVPLLRRRVVVEHHRQGLRGRIPELWQCPRGESKFLYMSLFLYFSSGVPPVYYMVIPGGVRLKSISNRPPSSV